MKIPNFLQSEEGEDVYSQFDDAEDVDDLIQESNWGDTLNFYIINLYTRFFL